MRQIISGIFLFTLLALSSTWVYAHQWPQRELGANEKLFFNEAKIDEIRARIDSYPWAQSLYDEFRQNIAHPQPLVGYPQSWGNSHWTRDAALYYRISGDEKYISQAVTHIVRSFALDKVERQKLFPDTTKRNSNLWTWLMFRGGLFVAYDLLKTHPQMQPYVPAMNQRLDEIITESRRFSRSIKRVGNTGFWAVTVGLGMAGFLRDDSVAIREAINNPSYGFKAVLAQFRDDGSFCPEPFRYCYDYVTCCLTILAEASRFNGGEDMYNYVAPNGASMKKMIDSYFSVISATGEGLSNGDMGEFISIVGNSAVLEAARLYNNEQTYRVTQKLDIFNYIYKDPKIAWAIAHNPNRNEKDFTFFGYTALTHGLPLDNAEAPEARSGVYHQMGDAIIRSVEGKEFWDSDAAMIHVRAGEGLISHNHKDQFHFTLNAFGKNIYTDWFYRWDYLAPRLSNGYSNQTPISTRAVAHNTVVVDCSEPTSSDMRFSDIRRMGGMQIFTADGQVYDGVQHKRTFGVTREYIMDIFEISSQEIHTYDYIIHAQGQATYKGVGAWSEYSRINTDYKMSPIDKRSSRDDNIWFADANKATTKEILTADFMGNDGTGARTKILNNSSSEVIAAGVPYYISPQGWDDVASVIDMPQRKPVMIVRREAKSTTFFALHQPCDNKTKELNFYQDEDLLIVSGATFTDNYNLKTGSYYRNPEGVN